MSRQLVIRVEARGRVGEGKRTSNVGICGMLISYRVYSTVNLTAIHVL